MSEANQNNNPANFPTDLTSAGFGIEQPIEIIDRVEEPPEPGNSSLDLAHQTEFSPDNNSECENGGSSATKMNWQRVAHKLREYNRKLLKKVFRLEQELAEIDNKFNKYVEKSQNNDALLVQQAEGDRKRFASKLLSFYSSDRVSNSS